MKLQRIVLALLAAALAVADAVKLKLPPYSTQCVTEVAQAQGDLYSGSFVGSIDGGPKGDLFSYRTFFDYELKGPSGALVHQIRNRQDGKFELILPEPGRYSACIRNYGRHNTEVVYHAFVGHKDNGPVDHGKVTTDQLQPVRNTLRSLKQTMRQLLEEQRYQGTRDTVHLATNTSTGRRAVLYAVLEALSLIGISVAQVLLVKRLFDGKSRRSTTGTRFGGPSWGV